MTGWPAAAQAAMRQTGCGKSWTNSLPIPRSTIFTTWAGRGWAILAAVAPQGSAAQALIEQGWRFERTKVGGRNEHASGYEQALPAYADAVGTLDEFLAGDAEVDPTLHPLRRREAEPIVGPRRPGGDHSIHELVAAQIERTPRPSPLKTWAGPRSPMPSWASGSTRSPNT